MTSTTTATPTDCPVCSGSGIIPCHDTSHIDHDDDCYEDCHRCGGYGAESHVCECEIDWNCGCGRYQGLTRIETRYQGHDDWS